MKRHIIIILALALLSSGISFSVAMFAARNHASDLKATASKTVSLANEDKRKIAYELGDLLGEQAQLLPPKKWHKLTVYETSNGGYVYYLGTNILNGLTFYWDGDLNNQKIQALDSYSSEQLHGVKVYTGKDLEQIKQEWENSDTVKNYLSEF